MTLISKNVYIDKLDDIVGEYNNKYHRTIRIKPIDVKDNTYINIDKEVHDNDRKFKVAGHVGISKYRRTFLKAIHQIGLKKSLSLKKIKTQFHGLMTLMILMVKKLLKHLWKRFAKNKPRRIYNRKSNKEKR